MIFLDSFFVLPGDIFAARQQPLLIYHFLGFSCAPLNRKQTRGLTYLHLWKKLQDMLPVVNLMPDCPSEQFSRAPELAVFTQHKILPSEFW